MDWFQGSSEVSGHSSHHRRKHHDSKHESARSIFGSGSPRHNSSRSSFFGFSTGRSSSSYYKRSPRDGYLRKLYSKLRRLLRDLMYYLKKNPVKVFMLVIMPLLTGGALTGLLAKFGIRMPAGLTKLFGSGAARGAMDLGRSGAAMGGLGSLAAGMGGVAGLAKMFV